jgi:hypothetical protein
VKHLLDLENDPDRLMLRTALSAGDRVLRDGSR